MTQFRVIGRDKKFDSEKEDKEGFSFGFVKIGANSSKFITAEQWRGDIIFTVSGNAIKP